MHYNRDLHRASHQFRREHYYPELELVPDLTRGEQRLAAEVASAELRGEHVPTFAHERAVTILEVMARA
jgi:hypothetical protein